MGGIWSTSLGKRHGATETGSEARSSALFHRRSSSSATYPADHDTSSPLARSLLCREWNDVLYAVNNTTKRQHASLPCPAWCASFSTSPSSLSRPRYCIFSLRSARSFLHLSYAKYTHTHTHNMYLCTVTHSWLRWPD